ncbi:MAG: triose-phosphate isomerase [Deltaproteobacteria bacterium]
MTRNPIIVGNWKMHKSVDEAIVFAKALAKATLFNSRKAIVAPPFTAIYSVASVLKNVSIAIAAQNVYEKTQGAYTGEISAPMLADVGCRYIIVGHSERRAMFGEDNSSINRKTIATINAGLTAIICVGEVLAEKQSGVALQIIKQQLMEALAGISIADAKQKVIIAYEPVWAIGTGQTATPQIAQEVHSFIRKELGLIFGLDVANSIHILYGGSVNVDNVSNLMAQSDIDGVLVGGASLVVEDFIKIINYL